MEDIRVKEVKPLEDCKLELTFNNGDIRIFNVKPYTTKLPFFQELLDQEYFKTVKVKDNYSIEWPNGHDFCPDVLYKESYPLPLV